MATARASLLIHLKDGSSSSPRFTALRPSASTQHFVYPHVPAAMAARSASRCVFARNTRRVSLSGAGQLNRAGHMPGPSARCSSGSGTLTADSKVFGRGALRASRSSRTSITRCLVGSIFTNSLTDTADSAGGLATFFLFHLFGWGELTELARTSRTTQASGCYNLLLHYDIGLESVDHGHLSCSPQTPLPLIRTLLGCTVSPSIGCTVYRLHRCYK
mmetsp:Transcript_37171/g.116996  ORF Transcript_37171/g.116996 Transcript_37171/m.116996 type:complete len:217 (-) Transcript_37171:1025-1675(-)